MSGIEVEFPKGTKIKIKGPSKFVIVVVVLVFVGIYLIKGPPNFASLVAVLSAMIIFLLIGAGIMERQRKKYGKLIH